MDGKPIRRSSVKAAVMLTAQTASGSSTNGQNYELDAIAAVIIGGTLLTGGRGTLVGTFLGMLVFTLITNLFILNNLSTPVQNLAKGLIILGAVLLRRRLPARGSRRRCEGAGRGLPVERLR